MSLKDRKDIGEIIRDFYIEYYCGNSDDDFLSEGAVYRRSYYHMLYRANIHTMARISKLLDSNEQTNSGFTYGQCSSMVMYCVDIIKWSQSQEKLGRRDTKEFELAKKILPYLYENMKADRYSTPEALKEREQELDKIGMDKKILNNFSAQIVKKEKEM